MQSLAQPTGPEPRDAYTAIAKVLGGLDCALALLLREAGSHGAGDFRQFRQNRGILQPQFVVDGGGAANQGSRGNIVSDSALRSDDGAVADFAVADHPNLTSQNHTISDFRGTGEADLGAE